MYAITANRLTDGLVVYLARENRWAPALHGARRFESEAAAEAALAAADPESLIVVSPYLIEIDAGAPSGAKRVRETIRLSGPTTGTSLRSRTPEQA